MFGINDRIISLWLPPVTLNERCVEQLLHVLSALQKQAA